MIVSISLSLQIISDCSIQFMIQTLLNIMIGKLVSRQDNNSSCQGMLQITICIMNCAMFVILENEFDLYSLSTFNHCKINLLKKNTIIIASQ